MAAGARPCDFATLTEAAASQRALGTGVKPAGCQLRRSLIPLGLKHGKSKRVLYTRQLLSRTDTSLVLCKASCCTTVPFRIRAVRPANLHEEQIKVPAWYDPLIKLDVDRSALNDWILNAGVYNSYHKKYDARWQPVTLMFHPDVTVNGQDVGGTTSNTEGCIIYVPRFKAYKEDAIIEGRLIMNQGFSLASNLRNLLSPKGLQSADLLISTKDGRPVPCHKMLLHMRRETLWPNVFSVPLTRSEDGSKFEVTLLQEFSFAAVKRYIKIVYTGEISPSMGDLDWANPDVEELAHIATKLGERDLLKILCNIHAFETADALPAEEFPGVVRTGEEQYWEAKKREAEEKLKKIHAGWWGF
ncbi:hypothetical protein KFL_000870040 [Klebsormidium nitens]|uniref:BTB domain-containing protein n=1 Tax=Klebsormidium nitens TaxID=105231 RepID=A0A1Y1HWW6_KLENI|nr:hypothetical protein KFL_000870040 [Klebsormidium nitens]|eukprot:GAQ81669.1 hypothetical protein KFL_000870040 [Klebsormidium nitens]